MHLELYAFGEIQIGGEGSLSSLFSVLELYSYHLVSYIIIAN